MSRFAEGGQSIHGCCAALLAYTYWTQQQAQLAAAANWPAWTSVLDGTDGRQGKGGGPAADG